ncbi:MAG: nucleotidyltransferase [Planctomycetes bacterium]|nr:nucleotidyltransferase [Planctomycetota bacterium]MBU1517776.1 nucleotidyltransferase [Planctomycetota bacterium]MBU2458369.1 nucleotidyltransferase [Planctomycetota bacterium]MBU2597371.1 nucleotidyltransferase [Planctomycetota bacterium]
MKDFFSLLKKLSQNKVDYVVVGGFACIAHGATFVTQDVDICLDFNADNLLCLQKALADLHPIHRMTPNKLKLKLTKENCKQYKNLYLDTDSGQLDCISFIEGVGGFEQVKKKSMPIKIEKLHIQILNLDALIEAKKSMNREKDVQTITQLETIKKLKDS